MKTPKIVTLPHPALRKKSKPVTEFTPELAELAQAMLTRMQQAEGVGLAANQIDVDAQIFVYGAEAFEDAGQKYPAIPPQAVINPHITVLDPTTETMDEGCLSIPGLTAPVARPIKIRLHAQDLNSQSFTRDISGYEARIVLHETDHLNGVLFLDHVTDPSKIKRNK